MRALVAPDSLILKQEAAKNNIIQAPAWPDRSGASDSRIKMPFEKKSLFPTNIYQFNNTNAEADNPIWRKAVYQLKEHDRGRVISNQLGWQSSQPLQSVPQLASLAKFILACLNVVGHEEGWAMEQFDFVIEGWANINGKWALNNLHNHPNCLLSGSYYIDTPPQAGDILFRDPRESAYVFAPPYTAGPKSPMTSFTPQPGMLFIFPAWLLHGVGSNLSDSDRVSIAFNANLEPRAKRPK